MIQLLLVTIYAFIYLFAINWGYIHQLLTLKQQKRTISTYKQSGDTLL